MPKTKRAAKKTAPTKVGPEKTTTTAFVLSQGSIPAGDVVAKAKAAGMTISRAHVYSIRAQAKTKTSPGRPSGKRRPGRPSGSGRAPASGANPDAEKTLMGVVLALGLTKTRELVDRVAERLEAVLR